MRYYAIKRLVELVGEALPTTRCDGPCIACDEDRELEAIIASVEVPNAS